MKKLIVILIVIGLLVAAVAYAPYYLVYADKPVQSDVIVLFVGNEFASRKQEAFKLIEEGRARYLIIPAYGKVSDAGLFTGQARETRPRPDATRTRGSAPNHLHYPRYLEDTHIEVLEAKKMMDKAGFKSGMFVSSRYHMRRISMIAKKVFGNKDYQLTFVPSRFEQSKDSLWFLNKADLKMVSREYSKIVWFMIYRFFPQDSADKN